MSSEEDIILAAACAKGIRSAQQFLYKKYAKVLYSIAVRYLSNTDEAKDLLHDSFLRIFEKINLYKGKGSLEGWLKRLIVNECISLLRIKKKMHFKEWEDMRSEGPSEEDDEERSTALSDSFTKQNVLDCLHALPSDYRIVFQMFALDDFSHKEIGEKLGIQENASRARFHRAKKMMKERLLHLDPAKNEKRK